MATWRQPTTPSTGAGERRRGAVGVTAANVVDRQRQEVCRARFFFSVSGTCGSSADTAETPFPSGPTKLGGRPSTSSKGRRRRFLPGAAAPLGRRASFYLDDEVPPTGS